MVMNFPRFIYASDKLGFNSIALEKYFSASEKSFNASNVHPKLLYASSKSGFIFIDLEKQICASLN